MVSCVLRGGVEFEFEWLWRVKESNWESANWSERSNMGVHAIEVKAFTFQLLPAPPLLPFSFI